jgi:hypothetical protein
MRQMPETHPELAMGTVAVSAPPSNPVPIYGPVLRHRVSLVLPLMEGHRGELPGALQSESNGISYALTGRLLSLIRAACRLCMQKMSSGLGDRSIEIFK